METKTESITTRDLQRIVESGARPKIILEAHEDVPQMIGTITSCEDGPSGPDNAPGVWILADIDDDGDEVSDCEDWIPDSQVVRRVIED